MISPTDKPVEKNLVEILAVEFKHVTEKIDELRGAFTGRYLGHQADKAIVL